MTIIVATNSKLTLDQNLLRSMDARDGRIALHAMNGFVNAGSAYNAGMAMDTVGPIACFIHQDVYLPVGWADRVRYRLDALAAQDPNWAVAGVWGICPDGQYAGRVWCSGSGKEFSGPIDGFREAESLDEIVLILNTRHGLKWDEQLPGFHLYATDIVMQARLRGLKSYVIDAPVVHNSRRNPNPLDKHYFAAYRYMRRKYREHLPIKTAVVPITRWGLPLYRAWVRRELRRLTGRIRPAPPRDDPKAIAVALGYEPAEVKA